MQIGFFVNDLEREYENYATTVLAHMAASRGHRVCYITPSDFALNPGGVIFTQGLGEKAASDAAPAIEPAVADAQCVDGELRVSEIRSSLYAARPMGRDNYHIYDYNLFHMNLRQNVEQRVAKYLEEKKRIADGG